ncbi:hypothetical protein ACTWJ8_36240 [Streptomyces sp. SDT5-1]|uniref:hypothetical protein n=1 Tax=Streptomyces sp. SDT5-1 TaxID=3406418 RepID=UPI003FD40CB3
MTTRTQLRPAPEAVRDAVAAHPGAEPVTRAGATIGVRLALADVTGQDLGALVRASWAHRAPKRLAAASATKGQLPAGIGRPATRALLGVGPKAVRVLEEELAGKGLALRS